MKELRLLQQNIVLISGYLAKDPEFRVTTGGRPVMHFRVGVTRSYKDKLSGEWKDDTAWVPVDVWGDAAERLKDRLKKGSPVHVEGRLRSREYDDKSGNKRNVLEVIANRVQFLAKLSAGEAGPSEASSGGGKADVDLEEVPF